MPTPDFEPSVFQEQATEAAKQRQAVRFDPADDLKDHLQTQAIIDLLREAHGALDVGTWVPTTLLTHPLLRDKQGRGDLPVILVLSDILFRFRPFDTLGSSKRKGKGEAVAHRVRFYEGDMIPYSYHLASEKLGLTMDQVWRAIRVLRDKNVVEKEQRNIRLRDGRVVSNSV